MGELHKKNGNEPEAALRQAMRDLLYLLERGYPRNPAIQLVGNRHALSSEERKILFRGVFPRSLCAERREKLVDPAQGVPAPLIIDGYNLFITLESYLRGRTVFIALDGFMRDVAGVFGGYRLTGRTMRCAGLLEQVLDRLSVRTLLFLDQPVSRSGDLAALLRGRFGEKPYPVEVHTDPRPDPHMAALGSE
ncbi:MAG: DUF434 domain-containing protein [Spirochaetota bacterium]